MSGQRSVAAAQRRRAGPLDNNPVQNNRGPTPSISSSQAFNNSQQQQVIRPGTSGRLAGQQAAIQQQQFQQNQSQSQNQNQKSNQNLTKMSVAQAITLITLRLGRVENQLQQLDPSISEQNDSSIIDNILQRLYSLEQNQVEDIPISNNSNNNLIDEINLIKQQIDSFKTSIVASRNSCALNNKDLKIFKTELEELKKDLLLTKLLVDNIPIEDKDEDEVILNLETNNTFIEEYIDEIDASLAEQDRIDISNEIEQNNDIETSLIIEEEPISLKEIIQQELKQSGISIGENQPVSNNSKRKGSNKAAK
jgi:hypothetical protein